MVEGIAHRRAVPRNPDSQHRIDMTMTSSFKAQSNRRNAQMSTGPRTEEGKSRSRFNALMHGITASFTVLPNENAGAYEARLHGFMTDFQPRSAFEHYLTERAVKESWISDRAMRAHTAHLANYMTESMAEAEKQACPDSPLSDVLSNTNLYAFDPSDDGERYRQYEVTCARAFYRTINLLLKTKRAAADSIQTTPRPLYYSTFAPPVDTAPPFAMTAPLDLAGVLPAARRESRISENEAKLMCTDHPSENDSDDCAAPASGPEALVAQASADIPCATGAVEPQEGRADVVCETQIPENEAKLMCAGSGEKCDSADSDGATLAKPEPPPSAGVGSVDRQCSIGLGSPGAIRFDQPGAVSLPRSAVGKPGSPAFESRAARRKRRREAARRK
jgi:hypothetical protein